jgi:hypothetical protein
VYELREPDQEGRWRFALNDAAGVSFKRDSEGKVLALFLHRSGKSSGKSFELPRDKPVDAEQPSK